MPGLHSQLALDPLDESLTAYRDSLRPAFVPFPCLARQRLGNPLAQGGAEVRNRTVAHYPAKSLPVLLHSGYTFGMKTAISIPDEVFDVAEKLARRQGVSRSRLFSDALREYVARHAPDEITDAMNRVIADIGESGADFAVAAARRVLTDEQW